VTKGADEPEGQTRKRMRMSSGAILDRTRVER
jgi:hypothetical protein